MLRNLSQLKIPSEKTYETSKIALGVFAAIILLSILSVIYIYKITNKTEKQTTENFASYDYSPPPARADNPFGTNRSPVSTPSPSANPVQNHIVLNLYSQDFAILEDKVLWQKKLDEAYEAMADLVGKVPFGGEKIVIKEVDTTPVPAEMLAGNPILWLASSVRNKLNSINNNHDLSFGPIHEMGHDFDIYFATYRYLDSQSSPLNVEQWANFRVCYAADTLGKKYSQDVFYQSSSGFLPINHYCRKYFYDIYSNEWLNNKNSDWTKMNSDAFTGLLYTLVEKYGWEPFKKTFREYETLTSSPPIDAMGKMQLFVNILNKYTPENVTGQFRSWGIPVN